MECEVGVTDVKISNSNMAKSYCAKNKARRSGTYFKANLIDPLTGFVEVPPFEIIIPHTNFLEFQGFSLWPCFLLGDVKIRIKASLQGCVIAQVPLGASIEKFEAQSSTILYCNMRSNNSKILPNSLIHSTVLIEGVAAFTSGSLVF
jgi:hypothetical protein